MVRRRHRVELAQHRGPHVGTPVVQLLLELVFDDLAFFFHHQDLLQPGGELPRQLRLQWPHHAHLVQADAQALAAAVIQTKITQGLARIAKGLATGHEAQAVAGSFDHVVVEAVGADVGQRRVPLVVVQPRLLRQRGVRPANVQTTRRQHEIFWQADLHALRIDLHGGTRFHNFLDGLHAGPDPGKTAQCKRVQAQVQDFLHAGGEKNRQAARLENMVALVRGGGTARYVVIAGDGNDAAPGRGAGHVGVLEDIGAAVHAGALAVPDPEDTVVAVAARRRKPQLLGAPQRSGGQLLVDAGLEHNVLVAQVGRGLRQRLVITAQRGATIAADQAGGVAALLPVALALQHRQSHQRMYAAHEGRSGRKCIAVLQGIAHCMPRGLIRRGLICVVFHACAVLSCRHRACATAWGSYLRISTVRIV